MEDNWRVETLMSRSIVSSIAEEISSRYRKDIYAALPSQAGWLKELNESIAATLAKTTNLLQFSYQGTLGLRELQDSVAEKVRGLSKGYYDLQSHFNQELKGSWRNAATIQLELLDSIRSAAAAWLRTAQLPSILNDWQKLSPEIDRIVDYINEAAANLPKAMRRMRRMRKSGPERVPRGCQPIPEDLDRAHQDLLVPLTPFEDVQQNENT
jgi:hypothetical protein